MGRRVNQCEFFVLEKIIFRCNVALMARSADALQALASECSKFGVQAHVIICDMSSKQSVDESCLKLAEVFEKRLEILINNAGISGEAVPSFEEKTPSGKDLVDMWEEVMNVNLVNVMRMTGRCLPMMKSSGHGAIITISSLAATVGNASDEIFFSMNIVVRSDDRWKNSSILCE